MSQPTAHAWRALELASQTEGVDPLEDRLRYLEGILDNGVARQIGTNIVETTVELPDSLIERVARYSVIEGAGTFIDESSRLKYSFLESSSVTHASDLSNSLVAHESALVRANVHSSQVFKSRLEHSTARNTLARDSHVTGSSIVRYSYLQHAQLFGADVYDSDLSYVNTHDVEVKGSNINGIVDVIKNVCILDGEINDGAQFIDFGHVIGTGERVFAYRAEGGGIVIAAGCREFTSVREMLDYAKSANEYEHLDDDTVLKYQAQIRAAAAFMRAAMQLWPKT